MSDAEELKRPVVEDRFADIICRNKDAARLFMGTPDDFGQEEPRRIVRAALQARSSACLSRQTFCTKSLVSSIRVFRKTSRSIFNVARFSMFIAVATPPTTRFWIWGFLPPRIATAWDALRW